MSQHEYMLNNSVSDRDRREESHRPTESAERGIAQRMEPQNIQERETQQVSPKIELQIKTIQNDLIVLENKQEFVLEQNSNIVALLSKFKSERKRKRQRTQISRNVWKIFCAKWKKCSI